MQLWLALAIPVIFMTGWFYTITVVQSRFPTLREKAIVLLIAHPDDEAMFFSPTILSLTRPELGNHLKILCLSNGNADGLGTTRAEEIKASATLLGLRSTSDVFVYDDPTFPDSMSETWSSSAIAALLNSFFAKEAPKTRKQANEAARGQPPSTTIDVLITFDKNGVSGHPNHRSLYYGAVEWIRSLLRDKSGWDSPVTLYTLTSTSIRRKYVGALDAPLTMILSLLDSLGGKDRLLADRLVFLNDVLSYRTAQKAMTKAHRSQMRWFRWGWIIVGRYMVVNDLKKANVSTK